MQLENSIEKLIDLALQEDIGSGDITTNAIIDKNSVSGALILAGEDLIVSGIDVARRVYEKLDGDIVFTVSKKEGDRAEEGEIIARLIGRTAPILSGERVSINFLQHLSGISTLTSRYAEKTKNTRTKILDTRKTTPGMRILEKRAVKSGGGENHRIGLYDMVLIKENHIIASGSIIKAVELARQHTQGNIKIEVETEDLIEVTEAIQAKADIIMLDNMSIEDMGKAIKLIDSRAKVEVSGNVTFEQLDKIIALGPDYISIGKLTHSAPAVDISLEFIPN
ncbi:carboxylating nicotinate-nucleotide diphosphorylase [bacterium]|nr:carboxylating nicotinate-nucleotide diphosphorylase [bacterium]